MLINTTMYTVTLDLHIPSDEYLYHYKGTVKDVVAKAHDGRVVRFPASLLQGFVTHAGIQGRFTIYFDKQNKFQRIERI